VNQPSLPGLPKSPPGPSWDGPASALQTLQFSLIALRLAHGSDKQRAYTNFRISTVIWLTLHVVTQMAARGLSANENVCALISYQQFRSFRHAVKFVVYGHHWGDMPVKEAGRP
jgi:hypothetical protein